MSRKNILFLCQNADYAGIESYVLNLLAGLEGSLELAITVGVFYQGPLTERLREKGVEILSLSGRNNLRSIRQLIGRLKTGEVDTLHMVDLKSTLIGSVASLFARDVTTLATVHGRPEFYGSLAAKLKYAVALGLYGIALRFIVDRVIFVAQDLKAQLAPLIGRRKCLVINNGLRLAGEPVTGEKRGEGKRRLRIGTVGRLEKVKGHRYFLEAAGQLLAIRDDVEFCVVGDGTLASDLRRLAADLGLTERVQFPGFRTDVHEILRDLDVFVLPSLHEGIPYVLLEAMSCGLPVVATRVGGNVEVVTDGVDGLLIEPGSPVAIRHAVERLLTDGRLAARLGRAAEKRVREGFSTAGMAAKYGAEYLRQEGSSR